MNKIISKIVGVALGLTMATGTGVAVATNGKKVSKAEAANTTTETIVFANCGWSNAETISSYAGSKVSLTFAKGSGSNDPKYYNTGSGIRLYGSNTMTVTVTDSTYKYVTDISFTYSGSSYTMGSATCNPGTYTNGTNATWTYAAGTTSVVFTSANTCRLQQMTFTLSDTQSTSASLSVNKETLYVATTSSTVLSVAYANLSSNISISQSGSGSVKLSTDGETYTSSLTLDKSIASPQTVYVAGNTAGTATLSLTSGSASASCTVNVTSPVVYKKITKTAEIKDGGKFVIVATGTTKALSKEQLTNGRGNIDVSFVSGDVNLPTVPDAAVLTLTKGAGTYENYYTIFDAAYSTNGGYLEYYNSNLTTFYTSSTPSTDAFYWNISFNNDHVVLENKANTGNYLEYNSASNASCFRLYGGTQTKIDLYELESDVPSGTALTGITADSISLGAGSTETYTATYAPANATEAINVTLGSAIATIGAVSMSNGTVSFTITAGENAGSTTMTLAGEDGNISEEVTLTVSTFVSTHTLVTSASSLANGAKVVFGSTSEEENTNYSGAAHTGGDYVPVVATGYNSTKTALAAAATTKEYTVWCVDSTNGYYVLSDGGYFLAAPTSAGNKLNRVDTLGPRCYFVIEDSADGILLTSQYGIDQNWQYQNNPVDYTIQYNYNSGTNARFALYRADTQKAASLYISNESVNKVQGFVDAFMHFGNVGVSTTTDTGACKESGKSYFKDAQTAYALLSASEKQAFCTESAYANAYARLSAWATANGYTFNSYSLVEASRMHSMNNFAANNNALVIVLITAFVGVTFVGGYFFLRKKKEQ